jgi:hypothetical protein
VIQNPGKVTVYPYDEVSLSFVATDNLSGVRDLKVVLDGAAATNPLKIAPYALSFGTHKVTVAAEDIAGNKSEITFNIDVVMDVAHLDDLIQAGSDIGKITNAGIVNSLLAKLKSESLQALANEVKAQSGKKIDKAFADLLLQAIEFTLKTDIAA